MRRRGPRSPLSDSEVLTLEIMGAFLGINTDKMTFQYFRRHRSGWFPGLRRVHM